MRLARITVTAVAAFALAACSPSEEEPANEAGDAPATSEAADSAAPGDAGETHGKECAAADFAVEGELDAAPEITMPEDCDPPAELLIEDIEKGDGAAVKEGDTAEVHYFLAGFSDGQQLDASWDRGETFPVENVGQAQVIQGWNDGLVGMTEGTRRLLVVPPELGYGASPGHQLEKETLVFVIDLVKVS
ncbi:MAG: FKBP-type peptidyl-prolyl cis-trans isomerase [Actinophytocola sp.]|nr:FKBP-type peptidyl-prolyl cis-trans isomerase [Actinophytocola sp.]